MILDRFLQADGFIASRESTINEGLAGDPSPIFTEATRILAQEGAEATIAYFEDLLSRQ